MKRMLIGIFAVALMVFSGCTNASPSGTDAAGERGGNA